MADIPQWRRRIPPSRSRTPMSELTELDHDVPRPPSALAASLYSRPATPKRGLRPMLSSYLPQSGPFATTSKPEAELTSALSEGPARMFPSWAVEDTFPNPSAEQLTDAVTCRLMSQPYDALPAGFNGTLLQILEAHRDLSDERNRLERRITEEVESRLAERSATQQAESLWEEERRTYKAEVKRLELVIAKGKRGVAEVALVRQDSLIRRRKQAITPDDDEDDGKETVFEFLEKTKRFEDPSWSGQRATMKPTMKNRPESPSAKMAKLSKKLTKKISKTSLLAELHIPLGTPPPPHLPSTSLLQASYLEDQANALERKRSDTQAQSVAEPRVSISDDTTSTFSCAGDFLPDEASDKGTHAHSEHVSDSDFDEIRKMAVAISSRRGVNAESIMPRLLELFRPLVPIEDTNAQHVDKTQSQRATDAYFADTDTATPVRKPSHIMGFINKMRPQLSIDTRLDPRRFSFEFGDDAGPMMHQDSASRESMLRKSASLPALPELSRHVPAAPMNLSPIESSPTTSARTSGSRSKIPSPAYNPTFARPRQQREDSTGSLLTVMRDAEYSKQRSSSGGSSVYSSRSLHHDPRSVSHTTSRPAERIANRAQPDRKHGFSLSDAAGTANQRHMIEQANAVRAGMSTVGSTVSTRGSASADVSNVSGGKTHSPAQSVVAGRSRLMHDASVHPSGHQRENARPFANSCQDEDDEGVVVSVGKDR